ncbi:DUF342 domain-containing protein [Brevibacterium sp. JNUCC-42]|nr:DUF342 domain-containing protein [Brevibacterium sp. JNUCC-42]
MSRIADYADIHISSDKLIAEITMKTDSDIPLKEEDLIRFCETKGLKFGLIENHIRAICSTPSQYVNIPLSIAKGQEPVAGKDGSIRYLFQDETAEKNSPKMLEDGRVDYYSVLNIANVTRGQLLAEKIMATPGEPGRTVTGEVIPPKPGKEAMLKPGKGIVLNEERTLAYAVIDGQVSVDNDKIHVFPVYEVNGDVDFSVGNIDFVGTVVIRGHVPTGFTIKATGDIRIYGSVEGAELIAEGSIDIKNGIAGQDKGHVQAGNNVTTSYIQNGNVTAGNNVFVKQSIMFSRVRAGKQVVCKGTKGIIIGGVTQAGEKIIAQVVGNMSSTPTSLEVGAKPQSRDLVGQIKQKLTDLHDQKRKADQGLQVLNQMMQAYGDLPADKKALQIKLTNTQLVVEKDIKVIEEEKRALEAELEKEMPAYIEVSQLIFPGAKLVFGKHVRFIKQEFSRTRFLVLDGEISTSTLI